MCRWTCCWACSWGGVLLGVHMWTAMDRMPAMCQTVRLRIIIIIIIIIIITTTTTIITSSCIIIIIIIIIITTTTTTIITIISPRRRGSRGEAVNDTIAEARAKLGQVGVAGGKAVSPDHGHDRRELVDQTDQVSAGLQGGDAQVRSHGFIDARSRASKQPVTSCAASDRRGESPRGGTGRQAPSLCRLHLISSIDMPDTAPPKAI